MIAARRRAEERILSRYSPTFDDGSRFIASAVMPMIALSGVRISWLMFARNWLLARFAVSACSFACFSSSWTKRRSARCRCSLSMTRRMTTQTTISSATTAAPMMVSS